MLLRVILVGVSLIVLGGCDFTSLRTDPTENSTRVLGPRAWVIVTTDGGRREVTRRSVRLERGDTAVDALSKVADVRTTLDGTIAQVNGEGGGALRALGPEKAAWYFRVDGIESIGVAPDRFRVQPGQSVWWDLRRFDIYERLPVSVGTFPEPLMSGWRGNSRRLRIAYGRDFQKDAHYFRDTIFDRVDADVVSLEGGGSIAGVGGEAENNRNASAKLPVAVRTNRANFIIGRWEELRLDPNLIDIALDPRSFGLTIWFEGNDIMRQDPDMEFSERLQQAEGVIWASTVDGEPDGAIVFVVTGITDDGVRAAARTLRSGGCQFFLACAVDREGRVIR